MSLQGALILARALHFGAVAILWGGGGLVWILRAAPRGSMRLVRIAALVAMLSGLAWLGLTLIVITGDSASLIERDAWSAFSTTAFGPPWLIRLLLLAGGAGLAFLSARTGVLVLLGGGLALDQAWLGHAATGSGANGALMIAAQALHILAAYAWTGALPVLAMLVWRRHERVRALGLFSTLGLLAVATILATGLTNAAFRIATPSQLLSTSYGQILAAKIALFTAMLLLAWFNRRQAASGRTSRRLLAGIAIETAIGALVLVLAAVLGVSAPPG